MNAYFIYPSKPSRNTPARMEGIRLMTRILEECGYDRASCKSAYLTTVDGSKKPTSADFDRGRDAFFRTIGNEPSILVAMGSSAIMHLTKGLCPINLVRGEPVPVADGMPYPKGSLIYGMFDPLQVWNDPGCEDLFRRDIRHLVALMNGTPEEDPKVDNLVVHTAEEVDAFARTLPEIWQSVPADERFLVVDCEWQGKNWLEPGRYIRTVQVGYAPGLALTVELFREHPDFDDPDNPEKWPKKRAERAKHVRHCLDHPVQTCPDMPKMWQSLKRLLQDAGYPIVGHNVIADWQWLLGFGVDIRPNVVYDTMLAEHLINSDGPFRLDEVAMRRTSFGRYCKDVDLWVHRHKEFCKEGYGAVPASLLEPYGGADVECPRQIMKAQLPVLEAYGMLKPRGPASEYPSLLDSTLLNELATDEFEQNGLPVDRQRLAELIDAYQAMRAQLLSEITLMAMAAGMPDFNPNSQPQMRMLLFGKLGLTPVKTTGGQTWGDAVGNFGLDDEDAPASSTDKSVLEMLQDKHPLVKKLLQFRRIDQTCKTWLRHPDEDGEGGLEALLWSDGKLHASFLPTTSTGRYKTASPNCAPREVEVLTNRGWLHWDDAYASKDDETLLLAQWTIESEERLVTFARPTDWCKAEGEVVRVRTNRHIDILCTPNHRFEVYRSDGTHKCVTAEELASCDGYGLPQCGRLATSPGSRHLSDHEVSLLCATQADGYVVKTSYKGIKGEFGVEYAFTKPRKIERCRSALQEEHVPFRESNDLDSTGKPRVRIYVGKKYAEKAFRRFKNFSKDLFEFDAESISALADEVFFWDGTVRNSWKNYSSASKENADWVQILQILSGRRARPRIYTSRGGSISHQIDATDGKTTLLSRASVEKLDGRREVFCATMPEGTLIMRYNGKVSFTRNSQNQQGSDVRRWRATKRK